MTDRHSAEPLAGPGTACGLREPRARSLAPTGRGCFRFKCELNEEKNVSLGNSIGARSSDRCWRLLPHRAGVAWSRIANYFRGPAAARRGGWWRRGFGQHLPTEGRGDQGPARCTPLPGLGAFGFGWVEWPGGGRGPALACTALTLSEDFGRAPGVLGAGHGPVSGGREKAPQGGVLLGEDQPQVGARWLGPMAVWLPNRGLCGRVGG